jgi:hypothetical protein
MRWLAIVALAACGCSSPVPRATERTFDPDDDRWVIRGTKPERLFLTNGSFGLWIRTDAGVCGEDAFRFHEGQTLVAVPGLHVNGHHPLGASETLNWSFDLRTGEFVSIRRGDAIDSELRVVLHPKLPAGAVRWNPIEPDTDEPYGLVAGLQTNLKRLGRIRRASVEYQTYAAKPVIPGEMADSVLTVLADLQAGVFGAYFLGEDLQLPVSYDAVLEASKAAHRELWKTDIEIDGPADDQLAIRTMLYYIRRGATPKLPPFGASNAKYRGARFWDAEAWILPVLALVDRDKAIDATNWRFQNTNNRVPWEAANRGADVTPKEFGNALHVAGWVGWWFQRAGDLDYVHPKAETGILMTVMRQYLSRVQRTPRGYEIRDVESPDEGRLRNNDLVTNVLARMIGWRSFERNVLREEALRPLLKVFLPEAPDGLPATYDNDPLLGYQQTSALLTVFPLNYFKNEVASRMFDRYANLTSEVGPAMSESIHATIAARLKRTNAYDRWQRSWRTYTDDAMMFHEKRVRSADGSPLYPNHAKTPDDSYFMTGAAGCLQTVMYGFSGIGFEPISDDPPDVTAFALKRKIITFRPNLPTLWNRVRLKNIWLGNSRANVTIEREGTTIDPTEPGPIRQSVGAV